MSATPIFMFDLPAFPKPHQIEGHEYLTPKQRREVLRELCREQRMVCACGCNRLMTFVPDTMGTATIDHRVIQPMGHKKNDARSNLQAFRWDCNSKKGSKRE